MPAGVVKFIISSNKTAANKLVIRIRRLSISSLYHFSSVVAIYFPFPMQQPSPITMTSAQNYSQGSSASSALPVAHTSKIDSSLSITPLIPRFRCLSAYFGRCSHHDSSSLQPKYVVAFMVLRRKWVGYPANLSITLGRNQPIPL